MRSIPTRVSVLDERYQHVRYLRRADTGGLSEAECDALIAAHLDLIGETLREAAILPADSELRLLGRQIHKIDILCGEFDSSTDELRRLVLIEDKLLRNPQSRREVVAQILDYAATLDGLDASGLLEALDEKTQSVLGDQLPELRRVLAVSDFLLLIVGDDVQPRAAQLVERMARDRDPLSRTDVALLALTMFVDGNHRLLVPNVVGGIIGAQRELRITVDVRQDQQPLQVVGVAMEDSRTGEPPARVKAQTENAFFLNSAWATHDDEVARYRRFLTEIEDASIPGVRLAPTASGRPTVRIENTRVGPIKILSTMSSRPGIWDSLVARDGQMANADAEIRATVDRFRRELVGLGFTQHPSGRVEANPETIDSNRQQIIEAIRVFADVVPKKE